MNFVFECFLVFDSDFVSRSCALGWELEELFLPPLFCLKDVLALWGFGNRIGERTRDGLRIRPSCKKDGPAAPSETSDPGASVSRSVRWTRNTRAFPRGRPLLPGSEISELRVRVHRVPSRGTQA